jgi:Zn-dependent peptidase ImmA (M78 family)
MNTPLRDGRAVRYACAVLADCRIGSLPVDPFDLSSRAGITMLPLSQVQNYPLWVPYDIADILRMTCAVTLTYPTFCIVFRDSDTEPDRLRFALFHELGHIFMNHYRDFPDIKESARGWDGMMEAEADAFALNLMAPVPLVDVIRYNVPRRAKASLFGLSRSAWMRRLDSMDRDRAFVDEEMANVIIYLFHDFLLGRCCAACGKTFTDDKQENRCPFCGSTDLEWTL